MNSLKKLIRLEGVTPLGVWIPEHFWRVTKMLAMFLCISGFVLTLKA